MAGDDSVEGSEDAEESCNEDVGCKKGVDESCKEDAEESVGGDSGGIVMLVKWAIEEMGNLGSCQRIALVNEAEQGLASHGLGGY